MDHGAGYRDLARLGRPSLRGAPHDDRELRQGPEVTGGIGDGSIVTLGCGAAGEPDNPRLAQEMVEHGGARYVCYDNLAERTLAFAQLRKAANPGEGHSPLLRERMRLALAPAQERGVKLLGSFGGANPHRAGEIVLEEATAAGLDAICVGVVTGDDVFAPLTSGDLDLTFWETGGGLDTLPGTVVSAQAYLGSTPILSALQAGADVVVTGRVSDLSPYLAVLRHEFGWDPADDGLMAAGAVVGHLLECGRYLTGGFFAEPAYGVDVPDLAALALPLAEVEADGSAVLTKPKGSGGYVTVGTCKAQLLYEVQDPAAYLNPDVTIDLREVRFEQEGPDRVRMTGALGRPRPELLKVSVGVDQGWRAEGEVSFAGPGSLEKAEQSIAIVEKRLQKYGAVADDYRADLIGVNSIHGPASRPGQPPYEVRLRMAARFPSEEEAEIFRRECDDLWFGTGGAGGVRTSLTQALAIFSTSVERDLVHPLVEVTNWQRQEATP